MPRIEEPLSGPKEPWVDKLYRRSEKQGFALRAIAVSPRRPLRRVDESYGEIYEYDSEELPYPDESAERHALMYAKLIGQLVAKYGPNNVVTLLLPKSLPESDPNYPREMHRAVMVRVEDKTEAA